MNTERSKTLLQRPNCNALCPSPYKDSAVGEKFTHSIIKFGVNS